MAADTTQLGLVRVLGVRSVPRLKSRCPQFRIPSEPPGRNAFTCLLPASDVPTSLGWWPLLPSSEYIPQTSSSTVKASSSKVPCDYIGLTRYLWVASPSRCITHSHLQSPLCHIKCIFTASGAEDDEIVLGWALFILTQDASQNLL